MGAGFQSGASGQNVVDEKHVLAFQFLGVMHFKDVFHVLETLFRRFFGLCVGINRPDEEFVTDGDACHFGDALGNHQALVVAALLLALGMQWHWNQIVNSLKKRCFLDAIAQLLTEKNTRFLVAFVLQLVDEVLHLARLGKKEASCDSMKLDPALKGLGQRIVGVELVARLWQQVAAFQANSFFVFEQRLSTGSTHAGIEQIEDVM